MKKILLSPMLALLILAIVLTYNTLTAPDRQKQVDALPAPALSDTALEHFRNAIQFRTISFGDPAQWDSLPFQQFRAFLKKAYTTIHGQLSREIINGYSLFF